jgi:hypothetical protein
MEEDLIVLTEKDFDFFKKEVRIWLEILGMTDFKIDIQFKKEPTEHAYTIGTSSQRQYLIVLGSVWTNEIKDMVLTEEEFEKYKKDLLREVAHHEAMESFFYRMRLLCNDRFIKEEDIDDTIHSMIHRMEGAWNRFLNLKNKLSSYS